MGAALQKQKLRFLRIKVCVDVTFSAAQRINYSRINTTFGKPDGSPYPSGFFFAEIARAGQRQSMELRSGFDNAFHLTHNAKPNVSTTFLPCAAH
jgi:hypothetical protein